MIVLVLAAAIVFAWAVGRTIGWALDRTAKVIRRAVTSRPKPADYTPLTLTEMCLALGPEVCDRIDIEGAHRGLCAAMEARVYARPEAYERLAAARRLLGQP